MTKRLPRPDHLDHTIPRLAAVNGGMFSSAMAAEAGLDHHDLLRARRRELIEPLTRGWYGLPDAQLDSRDVHRRLAKAVQRRVAGSVISHESALLVHEIATLSPDLGRVHLTLRNERSHHRGTSDAIIHPADSSTLSLPDDATVVPVEFAVVAVGLRNPLAGLVGADEALHKEKCTLEQLVSATKAARRKHGWRAWQAMFPYADARSESPPESLARYGLLVIGLDLAVQHRIVTDLGPFHVDLACIARKLVIEVDGAVKYQGIDSPSGKASSDVVMQEKAREAALVRAGWRVLRLTWREIVTKDGELRFDNLRRLVDNAEVK